MTAVLAPAVPVTRWRRMLAPVSTAGGLAVATLAVHVRDPHVGGSWGYCPSAMLGLACPGCGGLRAVHDLTNGDVGAAVSSNLVVVALLPVAVVLLGVWAADRWRGRVRRVPWTRLRPVVAAVVAVFVVFTVVRNTGAGASLAPPDPGLGAQAGDSQVQPGTLRSTQ